MKRTGIMAIMICLVFAVSGYATDVEEVEDMLDDPINCATAEGDIRMLEAEKAHVAEQVAKGVLAIVPISAVVGIITGKEKERLEIATGKYDKMIDEKIAKIKEHCGIE